MCRWRSGYRPSIPRAIRQITDRALERLSPQFGTLYIHFGRPSVPPEKLLRALLLQALYTIRSAETERLLSDDHFTVDGTLLKA